MVTSFDDDAIAGGGRVGQVVPDLLRRERIGDIDEPQALGEPGERDHRAGKALGRLVAAAHRRLRAAVLVEARHLEGRDRHRQLLDR